MCEGIAVYLCCGFTSLANFYGIILFCFFSNTSKLFNSAGAIWRVYSGRRNE